MTNLRLLAIIEATSITGPAKNLLEFARLGKDAGVDTSIATFARGEAENLFIRTAREAGIAVEVIPESGPFDPSAMRALAAVAGRLHPDIIQTHAVKSHFLARLASIAPLRTTRYSQGIRLSGGVRTRTSFRRAVCTTSSGQSHHCRAYNTRAAP